MINTNRTKTTKKVKEYLQAPLNLKKGKSEGLQRKMKRGESLVGGSAFPQSQIEKPELQSLSIESLSEIDVKDDQEEQIQKSNTQNINNQEQEESKELSLYSERSSQNEDDDSDVLSIEYSDGHKEKPKMPKTPKIIISKATNYGKSRGDIKKQPIDPDQSSSSDDEYQHDDKNPRKSYRAKRMESTEARESLFSYTLDAKGNDKQMKEKYIFLEQCMDIFMFLNIENDNYIQIKEFEELKKIGIETKMKHNILDEKIIETFIAYDSMNKDYLDFWEFSKLMRDLDIDTNKMSEKLYDLKFGKCGNIFLRPCKSCLCRSRRDAIIKDNIMNEKSKLNIEIHEYKQNTDSFLDILFQKIGVFVLLGKIYSGSRVLIEKFLNLYIVILIYYESQKPENLGNKEFRILISWLFMNIMSPWLISYSTMLKVQLDDSTYQIARTHFRCPKFTQYIFLSFFGQFYCVVIEMLFIFQLIGECIVMLGPKENLENLQKKFTQFYKIIGVGLTAHEMNDYYNQRRIATLLFVSSQNFVMKILIYNQTFQGMQDFINAEEKTIVISILLDFLSIVSEFYIMYCESQALKEKFLNYCMLCLRGKHGWAPFIQIIAKGSELERVVDYSEIRCHLPGITNKTGYHLPLGYQFNDKTLINLTESLYQSLYNFKFQNGLKERGMNLFNDQKVESIMENPGIEKSLKQKYEDKQNNKKMKNEILIGKSINYASINLLIRLIHRLEQDFGQEKFKFVIHLDNANWNQLLCNAKFSGLISQSKPYIATTNSGQNFLQICVDNDKAQEKWIMETAFQQLIRDGCDANFIVPDTNQPLFLYAYKNHKNAFKTMIYYHKKKEIFDWKQILQKCYKDEQGKQQKYKSTNKQEKKGKYWLEICIDSEPKDQKTEWNLEEFMKELIQQEDLDIHIINKKHNEPILLYAKRKGKDRSVQHLLGILKQRNYSWDKLIQNCKKLKLISEKAEGQNLYELKNSKGTSWLQTIVDTENEEQWKVENTWIFEELLRQLLNNGFNPDIQIISKDQTLLEYVDENKKTKSKQILESYLKKSKEFQEIQVEKNKHLKNLHSIKSVNQIEAYIPKEEEEKPSIKKSNNDYNSNIKKQSQKKEQESKPNDSLKNLKGLNISSTISKVENQLRNKYSQGKKEIENKWKTSFFDIGFEAIACVDLVTDLLFVKNLYNSIEGHNMWFTFTLYALIAPYLVCSIPYLNFQLQTDKTKINWTHKAKMIVTLTPLNVLYLILQDLVYLINTLIIQPILLGLRKYIGNDAKDKVNEWIWSLFNMNIVQMQGFRRLRQVSQLNFESFPQIVLQIRILNFSRGGTNIDEKYGVSETQILISLAAAFIHVFLELIVLHLERKACKMGFFEYLKVCYNGRLNWVPFISNFYQMAQYTEFYQKEILNDNEYTKLILDYDHLESSTNFCFRIQFKMNYEFSNKAALQMIQALRFLSDTIPPQERIIIKVGRCFKHVKFDTLIQLIQVAEDKVILDIAHVDVDSCLNQLMNHTDKTKPQFRQDKIKILSYGLSQININQYSYKKIHFDLGEDYLKELEDHILFDLLKESHKKAILNVDYQVANHIFHQSIENFEGEDISDNDADQCADRLIHLFYQLHNQQNQELNESTRNNQEFLEYLKSLIVQKNLAKNQNFQKIMYKLFYKIMHNDGDPNTNEIIIQNLQQCKELLMELKYQDMLCWYLDKYQDIAKYIKMIQYDEIISKVNKPPKEFTLKNLEIWMISILKSDESQLKVHKQAISNYLRSIITQSTDLSKLSLKDYIDLIEYPRETESLKEYDLRNLVKTIEDGKGVKMNYDEEKYAQWIKKIDKDDGEKIQLKVKLNQPIYIRGFGLTTTTSFIGGGPWNIRIRGRFIQDQEVEDFEKTFEKVTLEKGKQTEKFMLDEKYKQVSSLLFEISKIESGDQIQLGSFSLYI